MRLNKIFYIFIFASSAFIAGCGSTPAPVNSTNTANSNAANSTDPLATKTKATDQITNDAPTLSPVYKAYCAAMVKKDEAAVRNLLSSDTIKNFEEQMKEEKITDLLKFLDEEISLDLCEVKNEEIKGDEAVALVKTKWAPNGVKMTFAKEGGEWKLTNIIPDADTPTK